MVDDGASKSASSNQEKISVDVWFVQVRDLELGKKEKTRADKTSRWVSSILENLEHGINIFRKGILKTK